MVGSDDLHAAALRSNVKRVRQLLASGADARATNAAGATPLHYGAGNPRIVELLLRSGADPNALSIAGTTPLHVAATKRDGGASVRQLLGAGARVDAARAQPPFGEVTALTLAILFGNDEAVDVLLAAGAHPGGTNGTTPVMAAALTGRGTILRKLIDRGGAVNLDDGFAGHALNNALYMGHQDIALYLIHHGADIHQPSSIGERVPPIVWAAYSENGDPTVARLLLERGADITATTSAGNTVLSWALRRGETELTMLLRLKGAPEGVVPSKTKSLPRNTPPMSEEDRARRIRTAVQSAIDLLQRSSDAFLANGFVRQSECVSCHHQTLPAIAYGRALTRGFVIDEASLVRQLTAQQASWGRHGVKTFEMLEPVPDAAYNLGYGLVGLNALGYQPDSLTAAMVWYVAESQLSDGSWPSIDRRPPLAESRIVGTALALYSLQLYPQPWERTHLRRQIHQARAWLLQSRPATLTDAAFRLLGLHWAGTRSSSLKREALNLLASQRPDGGWAPLPSCDSDAWATGLALFTLHETGVLDADSSPYRRGVDYLLQTQFDDGSWWVRSRTWPFQPHFDSQFPHGKDQWISAAATAWAVLALLNTIDPATPPPVRFDTQSLIARHATFAPVESLLASDHRAGEQGPAPILQFDRDIRPLLERSCLACHSGEKAKGSLRLDSLAGVMQGGQSGEPAVIPGRGADSPLVRFVSDQVEDLEMPPKHLRHRYPPLSSDDVQRLRDWIDLGAR